MERRAGAAEHGKRPGLDRAVSFWTGRRLPTLVRVGPSNLSHLAGVHAQQRIDRASFDYFCEQRHRAGLAACADGANGRYADQGQAGDGAQSAVQAVDVRFMIVYASV